MNQNNWLNSLGILFNFFYGKRFKTTEETPKVWLTPLVGMIPGLICSVFAGGCIFLMGTTAGGILTAIFVTLFLEIISGWRGLSCTAAWLDQILSKGNFSVSLSAKGAGGMQSQILFISLYLFRMALFGLIAAKGNAVWFCFALGGAYLIRGAILFESSDDPDVPKYADWILYIAGSLIAALFSFHMKAVASFPLALIGTALILIGYRRYFWNNIRKADLALTDLYGYLAENILLILGLIVSGGQING
jgi:hypothetical protein